MARICHRWLYFFCGFPGHGSIEHAVSIPDNSRRILFPLAVPLGNRNGIPPSFEPGRRLAVLKIVFAPLRVCFHRLNALRQRSTMGSDENGIYGRRDRCNRHHVFAMRKKGAIKKNNHDRLVGFFAFVNVCRRFFLLPLNYPNNTKIEP